MADADRRGAPSGGARSSWRLATRRPPGTTSRYGTGAATEPDSTSGGSPTAPTCFRGWGPSFFFAGTAFPFFCLTVIITGCGDDPVGNVRNLPGHGSWTTNAASEFRVLGLYRRSPGVRLHLSYSGASRRLHRVSIRRGAHLPAVSHAVFIRRVAADHPRKRCLTTAVVKPETARRVPTNHEATTPTPNHGV